MRWTKIIAHKIILLVLLTTVGCYTIPEFPDIERNDKEYFDYYGYGQPYPLAYLHWQNEQRSLRLMRHYDFFNYPVYQNRYPYYAYPNYASRSYAHRRYNNHIHDVYHNPVENQNTKIIVHKLPLKNNSTIKRKVWENRQNTSRVRVDSKMKPKPFTQQEVIAHQQAKRAVERRAKKEKKPLTQQEIIAKQQAEMKKKKDNE